MYPKLKLTQEEEDHVIEQHGLEIYEIPFYEVIETLKEFREKVEEV